MYKISEFILENENKTNKKNIKFTLKENFTLQIEKSPSSTSQSTPMNLINYVINIPRDISNCTQSSLCLPNICLKKPRRN